ncbi:phospholipase effector Tle1 domain-containing protein [Azospirillum thiophilum]|uniref:phospholipase effector Tle1 domain-containing protein n=1 Tax=Azospirillum thiophilum TaxID=528244 RepID=UPI001FE15EB2|nr:DUF2235 domain-containing protein [Azospirillum thiophilum]
MMAKRIVLCFDGTWNRPGSGDRTDGNETSTNVWKFYKSILPNSPDGAAQIGYL